MPIITIFNYFKKPISCLPLLQVLLQIKNGKYQKDILLLRQYFFDDWDNQYDTQKRQILRFSPSGHFIIKEEKLHSISYSGLLLLEIPYLSEYDLKTVKMLLSVDPFIYSCFENALGNGLMIIVKTAARPEDHEAIFKLVVKYYEWVTGIKRFLSDGVIIEHTGMVSFDTSLYLNTEAVPFPNHQSISLRQSFQQNVS